MGPYFFMGLKKLPYLMKGRADPKLVLEST